MGLFDDLTNFLETRLEEFLRNNPHLELQALEEQLEQQESDAMGLLADLQRQEKRLKDNILGTAKEVQLWHERIEKARRAQRHDLLEPAQEREAALLRQGNLLWGQMQGVKERMKRSQELVLQIQARRKEVQVKTVAAQAARASSQSETSTSETMGWSQSASQRAGSNDQLDEKFRRWELEEELEVLKKEIRP
jgi:uncharacterized protein (TIGR04376 family)